jgi:hypothetical protein
MKLIILILFLISHQVMANTVYKFILSPNEQIKYNCDDADGDITQSKIKLTSTKLDHIFELNMKAKVCTTKYGFRKVYVKLIIPSVIMNREFMLGIKPGEKRVFEIENTATTKDSLMITRLKDAQTLATYKLKWQSSDTESAELESVQLYIEMNDEKFRIFQENFGKDIIFPRIMYVHRQKFVKKPFILLGNLEEVSEEDF